LHLPAICITGLRRRLTLISGLLPVLCQSMAASMQLPATDADLTGLWCATPECDGRRGRIAIEIERGDTREQTASLSLVDIKARDIALRTEEIAEDKVRIGPIELMFNAVEQTLSGTLAAAVLPAHAIRVTFRQVAELESRACFHETVPDAAPVWTAAACARGTVYAGDDGGRVRALAARTGEPQWGFATQAPIRARPVIAGEYLLVNSDDGCLYRLNLRDGTVSWRARLSDELRPRTGYGRQGCRYDHQASAAATISGGTIFVCGADSTLFIGMVGVADCIVDRQAAFMAFDRATGRGHRKFALTRPGEELIWGFASSPAADHEFVFVGSLDGRILALARAPTGPQPR
jgi:hypothetical protein